MAKRSLLSERPSYLPVAIQEIVELVASTLETEDGTNWRLRKIRFSIVMRLVFGFHAWQYVGRCI